ncbi:importin-4-like [Diorhabda carinulata]|uniref:importin-4-like n=1 Tax=Diorhabda sublineata TaxID=1163346 RepID=UPI0024E055D6|nr:importin-4-like [Diorhabda sublineata]XP_057665604.1 importin-4-like [Diorhabda carinulata]
MEEILSKLLVSNSKTIQEGTKELREAFKKPEAVPALCDVLVTSSHPQIRQSAAVLLRRKFGKKRYWSRINVDIRNRIKEGMLQALVNEQEKLVKNSIAQFIGIIGKHEFPDNTWPEVLQFIHTLTSSENNFDKELGMYTLSIMTEIAQSSYIVHAESFAILFTNIINNVTDLKSNLAYYTVITMKNLVSVIGGHQQMINVYHSLLPKILQIINTMAIEDEKKAVDMFELLEELIEFAVSVVAPHLKSIIEMCLQLASNSGTPKSVQIKAISVVGWLIRSKGKVVQKNKLVEPIIDVLILLMAQKPEDEGNEEYFMGDPDQFTSITAATQTLDLIALNIPAEKVIPYVLTKVEPAIQGGEIYSQKAAYLSLAVLAEGCSECIRNKYLEAFLKCVCSAIHNPNAVVRNAAFFALGQFAEHLQPEISQYASELLPVLFECLGQTFIQMEAEKKDPPSLDRLFYALETFCENLDEGLLPYLPTLMERIFAALDPNGFSLQLKRVALSTLGSVASAVKEGLLPYFSKVIDILKVYINSDPNSEIHQIQCYAIESLAVVAQFIGPENFRPLTGDCLQLGLKILEGTSDPDINKSVYALFAALAINMKEELSPALPKIVNEMIGSIQSSEGIVTHYEDEDKDEIDVYGELSEDDEDIEEDIDGSSSGSGDSTQCRYSVENSYNEEKEQACLSLKDICLNTGAAFLPYIEKCFEEIFKLINYPQDDIRKASVEALLQFCITLYKYSTPDNKQSLYRALQMFVPKCAELIRADEERSVVMVCLDSYTTLLDEIKGEVFVIDGHREAIMNCVVDVLNLKTMCQDTDLAGQTENNEDDVEAEQDELLLESAGDVIPKFSAAIRPDDLASYFPNILQLMSARTKKQHSIAQRSFAFGTLAECMKYLDIYVEKFVPTLLNLWFTGARDSAGEVRNNAIFGLGEMILHGKDKVFGQYSDILQALSTAVSKETHSGTLDNICGALAKMILVNANGIPLDQVFPAFLQKLPLRDDFQENEAVVKCFYSLYQQGNSVLKQHLVDVIKVLVHIYYKGQTPNDDIKNVLGEFIKTINRDFPQEFANSVSSLEPAATESIQKLLSS